MRSSIRMVLWIGCSVKIGSQFLAPINSAKPARLYAKNSVHNYTHRFTEIFGAGNTSNSFLHIEYEETGCRFWQYGGCEHAKTLKLVPSLFCECWNISETFFLERYVLSPDSTATSYRGSFEVSNVNCRYSLTIFFFSGITTI